MMCGNVKTEMTTLRSKGTKYRENFRISGPGYPLRRSQIKIYYFFFTFNDFLQIVVCFLCLRLQQKSMERALDLTDGFRWEDLPTTDADTGHLTAAGWIPRIKMYTTYAAIALVLFHFSQSTFRIVSNHEIMFTAWYPFDWTVLPFYELVIISQVILYIN